MFCDEVKIKVIAGKGGDGCVSFRREKFVPKGGPDGGDGGHGGDIMLKVNPNLNTLSSITSGKTYKGKDGVSGKGKNQHGKNAEALILEVPPGTIVFNLEKTEQIADLNKNNDEFTIVKGGKRGLGNARFVSSTHQAPKFAENGEPGEEKEILLEMKLVADVGIIGLPSAGKSTLISVISNAKPKIAAYHFTTLTPNLGVVDMSKFGGSKQENFITADIPGLIEGASKGKGLGHQFLKHISRTKILIHLIDGTLEDIEQNFSTVNKELAAFDKTLSQKEQIVVLNKTDMLSKKEINEKLNRLKKLIKKNELFAISAITKEGIKPLLFNVIETLKELKKNKKIVQPPPNTEEIHTFKPHLNKSQFEIDKIIRKKDYKIFRITGEKIERMMKMTDINNQEGLERVYSFMEKSGIQKTIEKKGGTFGDFIKILDRKIPYRK